MVYPCHAVIVTLQIQTGEQRFFIGHTDKVSVTLFTQLYSNTVLVPQEYPRSVSRVSNAVLPAGVSAGLQWEQHLAGFRTGWFPERGACLGLPDGHMPLGV